MTGHLRSTGSPSTASRRRQCLTFLLGDAARSPWTSSACAKSSRTGQMTTVPLMPDFVRGVINLRGAVVPVIDLQARFGGPATLGKRPASSSSTPGARASASSSG